MRRLLLLTLLALAGLPLPAAHAAAGPACGPVALEVAASASQSLALDCTGAAPVTLAVTVDGARGHASISGTTLTYASGATTGQDRVQVVATDGDGAASAPLSVEVGIDVASRPSCAPATPLLVRPNAMASGRARCVDSRSSSLTYAVVREPVGATRAGTLPAFALTAGGAERDASFTYKATGPGGDSAPMTQPVTITAEANALPVCTSVAAVHLRPGGSRRLSLPCRDDDGDALTVTTTGPGQAGAALSAVRAGDGGGGASVVYTAPTGYDGPDSFTFRASDGRGQSTAVTVTVDVDPSLPNSSPTCNATTVSAQAGSTFPVGADCTDPDGDVITYAVVTGSARHVTVGAPVTTGSLTTFSVTLDAEYTGEDAGFSFTAGDGQSDGTSQGDVSIAIDRHGPVCTHPARGVLRSGRFVTVSLAALCPGARSVAIVDPGTHGQAGAVDANKAVAFQAAPGALDGDVASFAFTATDGTGTSSPVVVSYTTGPAADHPPSCSPPAATVRLGARRTLALTCTDADGDPLTLSVASAPARGAATVTGAATVRYDAPSSGSLGSDGFAVDVADGFAGATVRVAVAVTLVDRSYDTAPTCAFTLPVAPRPGETRPFTLTCTDAEGDATELIEARDAVNGSVEDLARSADPDVWTGRFHAGDSAGAAGFAYATTDALLGQADRTWVNVALTVRAAAANADPVCAAQSPTVVGSAPLVVVPAAACTDADGDTLSATPLAGPDHGALTPGGATATYTADAGYTGADTLTFTVEDGHDGTTTATVTVSVSRAPDPDPGPPAGPSPDGADPGSGGAPGPGGGGTGAGAGTAAGGQGDSVAGIAPGDGGTADTTAPALRVTVTRARLRAVVRRGLRVTLSCDEACTTAVTVAVPARLARRLGLARKPTRPVVVVRTSGTGLLRLRCSGRLARVRRAQLTVAVSATDAAGNRARRTVAVTLRR